MKDLNPVTTPAILSILSSSSTASSLHYKRTKAALSSFESVVSPQPEKASVDMIKDQSIVPQPLPLATSSTPLNEVCKSSAASPTNSFPYDPLPLLYQEDITLTPTLQYRNLIDDRQPNFTDKLDRFLKKLTFRSSVRTLPLPKPPSSFNPATIEIQFSNQSFDYSAIIADTSMDEVVVTNPRDTTNGSIMDTHTPNENSAFVQLFAENKLPEDFHCHDDSFDNEQQEQTRKAMKKLFFGLIMCLIFMIVELVGGYISHSLAIFTDAAHLSSDLVSFAISLLAIYMGQKKATGSKSFGYYRIEVIGVLFSIFSIWFMTGVLVYLAIERIIHQDFELESSTMLIVSSIGLGINVSMMCVLTDGFGCWSKKTNNEDDHLKQSESRTNIIQSPGHDHGHSHTGASHGHSHARANHTGASHGHSHIGASHGHSHMNMNVRAALLHLIGDIIQSVGVLIAALVIHFWPKYKLADPICTLIFGVLVFLTTYSILIDTLHILMEGFPKDLKYDHIRQLLIDNIHEVAHVHSLHVWSLTHGRNVMAVHLAIDPNSVSSVDQFESIRHRAERIIRRELHIHQTTIQVEYHQASIIDSCQKCIGPSL